MRTVSLLLGLVVIPVLIPKVVAEPLLLSGEVKAEDKQHFVAPMTDDWRVELQWLMPEGQIAETGEIVAVFDGSAIQGKIDAEEVALKRARETLQQQETQQAELVLQSEYALKREALLLKKAAIDAAIPPQFLSAYEYESFQVAKKDAESKVSKAKDALEQARLTRDVTLRKQTIAIDRSLENLAFEEERLASMSVSAERAGPVLYGKHPWTGERVFVGMSAQPAWLIAEIPSLNNLYIEAWLHEVDIDRAKVGQEAILTFDSRLDLRLPANLDYIATQPQKRAEWGVGLYYRVKFSLPEPVELELLPGMGARIELLEEADR
ncbi:HlyD family efflux transporter periplasmic adaptor subunit [Microbulbifer agarilyticus]|uniref:HlyD family secretion protein n=1 Tax=Microbulbifer agarilyticus TaxID=260552 RepID=UPI001C94A919|nr:HlyD family secretion protein [Microbulbifer agarilyticus]MBY6210964.1 HlyD family efflux transporter periplasmic adaptor subunit [Microbulbifer agarilyticus]